MSKLELSNKKSEDNLSNDSRQLHPIELCSKQSLDFFKLISLALLEEYIPKTINL